LLATISLADAVYISFPDGTASEYEPETGALAASEIKTANLAAAESVTVPMLTINASQNHP
jgi:phage baseplate assembly protein gpV